MNEDDKNTLVLAAKAGCIQGDLQTFWDASGIEHIGIACDANTDVKFWWNPFKNSHDALSLSAKLHMNIRHMEILGPAWQVQAGFAGACVAFALVEACEDETDATRRAITMAAALLGKVIPAPIQEVEYPKGESEYQETLKFMFKINAQLQAKHER